MKQVADWSRERAETAKRLPAFGVNEANERWVGNGGSVFRA